MSDNLFISFWDICLDNLPEGTFMHRRLSPADAKRCIEQARQENRLLCLSNNDLLAPYKERERKNHEALCDVLAEHFGIALSLKDFVSKDEDDGLYTINPLNCAQVHGHDRLLVITCAYGMAENDNDTPLKLKIEPTTVKFHLFESKENTN